MKFSRAISQLFIRALNKLYESEHSWWRKIADDDDVFILFRRDGIRVQANGGLLLHIRQDQQQNITCKARDEFLFLNSKTDPYVNLNEDSTSPQLKGVEGLKGFVNHYARIKQRINNTWKNTEKQAIQYLATHIPNVVDIEIGYEGEMKEGALKTSVPRIDMAAITNKGTLVFFEAKLYDNKEIRSKEASPQVVDQLTKYKKWLADNGEDIVSGYKEQLNIYQQLDGIYFKKRAQSHDTITLHPNPRLIITGFDKSQRDDLLSSFIKGIEEGVGWVPGSKDLIATGRHENLVKSNRLFLGLK